MNAPDSIVAGAAFEAVWSGPNNEFDQVAITNADKSQQLTSTYAFGDEYLTPATPKAPEAPGEYEVRLVTTGVKELAADTLTVIATTAKVTVPNSDVTAGNEIRVDWTGPDNEFDVIAIYSLDGATKFDSAYAYGEKYPSPAPVKVSEAAGDYLVRLMSAGGKELAKEKFTALPATASIDAPKTTKVGGEV